MKFFTFPNALLMSLLLLSLMPRAVAMAWNSFNDPSKFDLDHQFIYRIDQYPSKAFMTIPPWSESYWPTNMGSINYRWNSPNPSGFNYIPFKKREVLLLSQEELKQLSPTEKYDIYMGRYDYPLYSEVKRYGNPRAKDWSGICDGWSIASLEYPEPLPVKAVNGDGLVIPFGSSDIKALMSFAAAKHFQPNTVQIGLSCKWWSRNGACADINPGSLHVILGNYLGRLNKPFITERHAGYEIWNQPTFGYEFNYIGSSHSPPGINGIRVRSILYYTDELEQSRWEPVSGTSYFKFDTIVMDYILEIDANGNVIGGSWINGSDRPDFAWIPTAHLEFEGYLSGIYKIYRPSL